MRFRLDIVTLFLCYNYDVLVMCRCIDLFTHLDMVESNFVAITFS